MIAALTEVITCCSFCQALTNVVGVVGVEAFDCLCEDRASIDLAGLLPAGLYQACLLYTSDAADE